MDCQKGCFGCFYKTVLVHLWVAYVVCFVGARGCTGQNSRSSFDQITTYRENYILPYSHLSSKLKPRPATTGRLGPILDERLEKRFRQTPQNEQGSNKHLGHRRDQSSVDRRKGMVFSDDTLNTLDMPMSPEEAKGQGLARTLTLAQQKKATEHARTLVSLIGKRAVLDQPEEDHIKSTLNKLVHELVPRPEHELIENKEVIFQVSIKAPVLELKKFDARVYGAYTQRAWWQCFTGVSAFFREVNFMPEVFVDKPTQWKLCKNIEFNRVRLGLVHQSNGTGIDWERSWNRAFLEVSVRVGKATITITPWWVLNTADMRVYNPNIAEHLGYWQLKANFQHKHFKLSFNKKQSSYHVLGHIPLTKALDFIFYYFAGKGSTLGTYDRYNQIWGVGIGK